MTNGFWTPGDQLQAMAIPYQPRRCGRHAKIPWYGITVGSICHMDLHLPQDNRWCMDTPAGVGPTLFVLALDWQFCMGKIVIFRPQLLSKHDYSLIIDHDC